MEAWQSPVYRARLESERPARVRGFESYRFRQFSNAANCVDLINTLEVLFMSKFDWQVIQEDYNKGLSYLSLIHI